MGIFDRAMFQRQQAGQMFPQVAVPQTQPTGGGITNIQNRQRPQVMPTPRPARSARLAAPDATGLGDDDYMQDLYLAMMTSKDPSFISGVGKALAYAKKQDAARADKRRELEDRDLERDLLEAQIVTEGLEGEKYAADALKAKSLSGKNGTYGNYIVNGETKVMSGIEASILSDAGVDVVKAGAKSLDESEDGKTTKSLQIDERAIQLKSRLDEEGIPASMGSVVEYLHSIELPKASVEPTDVYGALKKHLAANTDTADVSIGDIELSEDTGKIQDIQHYDAKIDNLRSRLDTALSHEKSGIRADIEDVLTRRELLYTDIKDFNQQYKQSAPEDKKKSKDINVARNLLRLATDESNTKAYAQLKRIITTMVGDNRLSQQEIDQTTKGGDIIQRIKDYGMEFTLGAPSQETFEQLEDIIDSFDEVYKGRVSAANEDLYDEWSGRIPEVYLDEVSPAGSQAKRARVIGKAPWNNRQ